MTLKDIFDQAEEGTLSYDEFVALATEGKAKFVDLSEGGYVSKQKFDDELASRVKEIETLNETIATRDTDLADLQKQLTEAGTDAEKLGSLATEFDSLKSKYDEDVKSYKAQLKRQQYEFAVKEFANTKDFSSAAAKRDFVQQMLAKDLKLEGDKIMGAEDFVAVYAANNEDAFISEADLDDFDFNEGGEEAGMPHFVDSTQGGQAPTDPTGGFASAFHFTPIHPMPATE